MAQSNVVQITTKVTVQADALFADAVLANLIACAKEQRKMLKAQEMAFKILTDQIRESLGEFTTVIDATGAEIVTYNWVKGATTIDSKLLKAEFPLEYELCAKTGKPTRKLELK